MYNDILSKGDVKIIENGYLTRHLADSKLSFEGATGTIAFDEQGDRNVDDLTFSIINLFSKSQGNGTKHLNSIIVYKQTGKMFSDGSY